MSYASSFIRSLFAASLGIAALSTVCRAELLFERHEGGPAEYREAGNNHAADFQLPEATRIQAITGWFNGGSGFYGYDFNTGSFEGEPGRVAVSISRTPFSSPVSVYSPSGPIDYFTTFNLVPLPLPPPGELIAPGRWAGVGSLTWDLEPGSYSVNFFGAGMPLSYGYFGPTSNVSGFDDFHNYGFDASEPQSSFPFGVRIYGRPLSAVPEPSVYGLAGVLALLAVAASRRRGKASVPFSHR